MNKVSQLPSREMTPDELEAAGMPRDFHEQIRRNNAQHALDQRLSEIRARLDAATPGLWVWEMGINGAGPDDGRYQHIMALKDGLCIGGICDTYHKPSMKIPWGGELGYIPPTHGLQENASFIAHSHEDIPFLLGVIDDLRRTPQTPLPDKRSWWKNLLGASQKGDREAHE